MTLVLFFTRNYGLDKWLESGIFDREKLIYEEYLRKGLFREIVWITYGQADTELSRELKSAGRLDEKIRVMGMPRAFKGRIGRIAYSLAAAIVHWRAIARAQLIKTNQMDGCWAAVMAKYIHRKPLILRTGYTATRSLGQGRTIQKAFYHFVEALAYRLADAAEVSSENDREYVIGRYGIDRKKISILGNYVDTRVFAPDPASVKRRRAVFVGRLSPEKNLRNIIHAVGEAGLGLDIFGGGALEPELKDFAKATRAEVCFKGVVDNGSLAGILNSYRYFILCSEYEGMPKTLIEAMACGLLCIGTDVRGIRDLIDHGIDGYLAKDTSAAAIAEAIASALEERNPLQVSDRAVGKIHRAYSLEAIAAREGGLASSLLATTGAR